MCHVKDEKREAGSLWMDWFMRWCSDRGARWGGIQVPRNSREGWCLSREDERKGAKGIL